MKIHWVRSLSEVLGYPTEQIKMVSERTGNDYEVDIIPTLRVVAVSACEDAGDGKWRYSVVDATKDLEYTIKVPEKVEARFGTILEFKKVRGGATSSGYGWLAAESVSVVERNAK